MTSAKQIGIAIVEHHQRYLVGVRGSDVALAGCAEFPGGKCLDNESAESCAIRECLEETGLQVTTERLLDRREFEYPHGRVDLHFLLCHPVDIRQVQERHGEFRWVAIEELTALKFPEANQPVLNLLVNLACLDGTKPCSTRKALPESR